VAATQLTQYTGNFFRILSGRQRVPFGHAWRFHVGLGTIGPTGPDLIAYAMMPRVIKQSVAIVLVLCLLAVGGLASAQSISHESHHAHHHKAAHGTVLCTWMCAAGQVLDTVTGPSLVERASISRVELVALPAPSSNFSSLLVSRGPPTNPVA